MNSVNISTGQRVSLGRPAQILLALALGLVGLAPTSHAAPHVALKPQVQVHFRSNGTARLTMRNGYVHDQKVAKVYGRSRVLKPNELKIKALSMDLPAAVAKQFAAAGKSSLRVFSARVGSGPLWRMVAGSGADTVIIDRMATTGPNGQRAGGVKVQLGLGASAKVFNVGTMRSKMPKGSVGIDPRTLSASGRTEEGGWWLRPLKNKGSKRFGNPAVVNPEEALSTLDSVGSRMTPSSWDVVRKPATVTVKGRAPGNEAALQSLGAA